MEIFLFPTLGITHSYFCFQVSHYTGRIYLAAGIKEKDECYVTVIVSTSLAFVIMVSVSSLFCL